MDCEKLAKCELTRDDFLKEAAQQVDSTTDTDSPVKKSPDVQEEIKAFQKAFLLIN